MLFCAVGDGLVVSWETCDTGNSSSPGCVNCQETVGWMCLGEPSTCVLVACGDAVCYGTCANGVCTTPCLYGMSGDQCSLPPVEVQLIISFWPQLANTFTDYQPKLLCTLPLLCDPLDPSRLVGINLTGYDLAGPFPDRIGSTSKHSVVYLFLWCSPVLYVGFCCICYSMSLVAVNCFRETRLSTYCLFTL